jgi:hypothetical protein
MTMMMTMMMMPAWMIKTGNDAKRMESKVGSQNDDYDDDDDKDGK